MPDLTDLEQIPLADPDFDPSTVPFVKDIVDGKIAGVTVSEEEAFSPAFAPLAKNGRALFTKAGLVMTSTSKGAALFNPDVIKLSEVEALDRAGNIGDVLPPLSTVVDGAPGQSENPGAGSSADPIPRAPVPISSFAPTAGGPPPAASAQRTLTQNRVNANQPVPVTQRGSPTAGALLNRIRQPVI